MKCNVENHVAYSYNVVKNKTIAKAHKNEQQKNCYMAHGYHTARERGYLKLFLIINFV